jgi:hypothetical protein
MAQVVKATVGFGWLGAGQTTWWNWKIPYGDAWHFWADNSGLSWLGEIREIEVVRVVNGLNVRARRLHTAHSSSSVIPAVAARPTSCASSASSEAVPTSEEIREMKLHVTHDQEGNILAIAMQAPDTDGELTVLADVDQIVSEVQVEGHPADFADEEKGSKTLADIAERFKVDVAPNDVPPIRRRKLVSRKH